jgi:nicotinamide riboside kinase
MKVLNVYGGPCSGKSTTAAGLFFEMKKQGIEVELVQEYAKDMVWEQRSNVLEDQIYVFAKQQRRINRLRAHKLDWVITDSPIPLGLVYTKHGAYGPHFENLVIEVFNSYQNHNFMLTRNVKYSSVGRNQSSVSEAIQFDQAVVKLLAKHCISHDVILGGDLAVPSILGKIGLAPN